MEEDCVEKNNYLILKKIKKGSNVRLKGEDIKKDNYI